MTANSGLEKRSQSQFHPCGQKYDASHLANLEVHSESMTAHWQVKPEHFLLPGCSTSTPLHFAAGEGNVPIARVLLTYGAFVDCTDQLYETPLHEACQNRQEKMVRLLLDSGANPNSINIVMQNATHLAASTGCLESLKMLRDAGADLGLQDQNRFTPLHEATVNEQVHAAIFLTNESADWSLGLETHKGLSALGEVLAIAPSFTLNLAPCADAYEPREGNTLSRAASFRTATLKRFLRRMPKEMIPGLLNRRHRSLGTPLYAAIVCPQVDVRDKIDILLDAGADLELDGSDHGTPLMGACATGRLPAVKHLTARGAKTSYIRDGQVFSVLTAAKLHTGVVRWLLIDRFMELRFLADQ
ncbi:MAG: hypothetical protein LQ337_003852 [Flavoplaca oasis]|nr:MAG: hypothetical protein LQ337_003852 [Flavoplaca oasis]